MSRGLIGVLRVFPGLASVTALAALSAGCASVPAGPGAGGDAPLHARVGTPVPLLGAVEVNVHGRAPLSNRASPALLDSRLRVGDGDSLLRYAASYAVLPGDMLTAIGSNDPTRPTRLGGQRIGQQLNMKLPEFAGSPLSLGLASEVTSHWTINGYTRAQRERADLNWSTRMASVKLAWTGPSVGTDPSLPLDCALHGSVRVPTVADGGATQALSLSGRDCRVTAGNGRYDGLAAQTLGLAYAWTGAERETQLQLSRIDPVWRSVTVHAPLDPGYELGLRHRLTQGPWSANTSVSLRQATAVIAGDSPGGIVDHPAYEAAVQWVTNASLTRHLSAVSISATWAHGADPLWFLPEAGQRTDRFGLGLDFSPWARQLVPTVKPRLAMNWNWSQLRTPNDTVVANNSVAINLSVAW